MNRWSPVLLDPTRLVRANQVPSVSIRLKEISRVHLGSTKSRKANQAPLVNIRWMMAKVNHRINRLKKHSILNHLNSLRFLLKKFQSSANKASSSRMRTRVQYQANNISRAKEPQYFIGLSNPINCRISSPQSTQKAMNKLPSWLSSTRTLSWQRLWIQSSMLYWLRLCSAVAIWRERISSSMVIWGLIISYWHRELLKWQFTSQVQTLNHPTSKTSSWLKSSSKQCLKLHN